MKTEKHVAKIIITRWSTCLIIDKENLPTLILTEANVNICYRWLLMVSYLSCSQDKKACGCEPQKTAINIEFWKLGTTAVHEKTFKNIFKKYVSRMLNIHACSITVCCLIVYLHWLFQCIQDLLSLNAFWFK